MKRISDSELKQAVERELRWDTRVNEAEIGVAVSGGVVTLNGTVSSWGKRIAAEEATHRVEGAHDVANEIVVKVPGTHTDSDIAQAVRSTLVWDVFVPDTRIESTVSGGWVTLKGSVDYWTQRDDAERAVRNLVGVKGVINQIGVEATAHVPDVRKALTEALARHAAQDASRIAVDVHDGRVDLTGVVHSWAEKLAVMRAARSTSGVRSVEDHLRVEPNVM
jgi:osmotically-inducible protein OsmY